MYSSSDLKKSVIRAAQAMAVCLILPVVAVAQSAKDSAQYARAQEMVANGDAVNGRKLVDSVAAAAPSGSAAFAEGLFWRATLAANARDSEHEYRQIIVDYPLSGRVPDALLRIGQLEAARGENAAALQHFQRLVLEHPLSPLRAEASYWVARMYFDGNDATRACTANADALTSVKASNVELKNRIDFQQQRCRGVALATSDAAPAAPIPASTAQAKTVPEKKAPAKPVKEVTKEAPKEVTKEAQKEAPKEAPKVAPESATAISSSGASAAGGVVTRQPTKEEVDRALASAEQPVSKKTPAAAASSATRPATSSPAHDSARDSSAPAAAPSARRTAGSYAIQVAAFSTRVPANQLVTKLRGRGYDTYVDGTSAPYRVRMGHYPTHAAAATELAKLKARHIDGFVVER